MFEAGMAAAFAHRLVERIAARPPPNSRDIALAEAAHRIGRQLHFAHRHEIEGAQRRDGALRLGIEGADRFERIAEEIEPDRLRHRRREKIENAAAHRIFAGVAHGGGAGKAVVLQPLRQARHIDRIAGRGGEGVGRDFFAAAARAAGPR